MATRIFLKDIVSDTYLNTSGATLYFVLKNYIDNNDKVELSLKDSSPMSSSFLNSSVGELLHNYGFDKFKKSVKIIELTSSQALIIRNYLKSCGISI